jgi:hypothetical protein
VNPKTSKILLKSSIFPFDEVEGKSKMGNSGLKRVNLPSVKGKLPEVHNWCYL